MALDQANNKTKPSKNKSRLVRLVNFAAWLAMGATLIALFADSYWLADMLTHMPMQYLLVTTFAVPMAFYSRRWMFLALLVTTIGWNVFVVSPYVFAEQPVELAGEAAYQRFRVIVLNVLRTNEKIESAWNEVLETDADFIYLMEVHSQWKPWFAKSIEAYPHQKILSNETYTGVALLSKHPWETIDVIQSGIISNPSIDVNYVLNGSKFHLVATHPVPPFGPALSASREQQLTELAGLFEADKPNLFVGDFNVSPWSPSFLRILEAGKLSDATRFKGPKPTMGPLPTWFGGLKFDHVLASERIVTKGFKVESVAGSDHRMLVYDFVLKDSN